MAPATREELAALASGVGVELGVAAGDYSVLLLQRGKLDLLYSIDRWSDHHDDREMQRARKRLAHFGERSRVIHANFSDAVGQFEDGTFDFLYIDGYAHTGQENGETLRQWWPKLKAGGIFAGHDYCRQYPLTVRAVDDFAREHGLSVHVTSEHEFPSWMAVKP